MILPKSKASVQINKKLPVLPNFDETENDQDHELVNQMIHKLSDLDLESDQRFVHFKQEEDPDKTRIEKEEETSVLPSSTRQKRANVVLSRARCDPQTMRKCVIADYFFLDYYHDLLSYLHERKQRTMQFKQSQTRDPSKWREYCSKESAYLRKRRTRTNVSQFSILAQIGQGGYGQVYLARKKDTGEICALKKMSKILLKKMNEIDHIITERDVLTQTKTPWLVKLFYAFQDVENVFFAMEYVPGGDLRTLLNTSGILREPDARFYTAEMFMAVNELHKMGFLHRDLKPENFLIDTQGHVKLTDFGLSKGNQSLSAYRMRSLREKLDDLKDVQVRHYSSHEKRSFRQQWIKEEARAFSLVGSPDYMAPEILMQSHHTGNTSLIASGYDYLVDYWSLGCILFEFLAGYPPFAGPSMEDVWVNVYHWEEVLERPQYEGEDDEFNLSDAAWDMIQKLITHRELRISSIEQMQQHKWFEPMKKLLLKRTSDSNYWHHLRTPGFYEPPFIPELTNEMDHSHFDDFTDPQSNAIYKEVYEKQEKMEQKIMQEGLDLDFRKSFIGFTFKHKAAVDWQDVEGLAVQPAVPSSSKFLRRSRN